MSKALYSNDVDQFAFAKTINDAYDLRSEYLHHGIPLNDTRIVRQFLQHSWLLLLHLIRHQTQWSTLDAYIEDIDT